MNVPAFSRKQSCAFAIGSVLFLLFTSGAALRGVESNDRIGEEIEKSLVALRVERVTFHDADFHAATDHEVPPALAAAGAEFLAAWREYRRVLSLKRERRPKTATRSQNVPKESAEYIRLINELLEGNKPPTPEQLAQFFYDDHPWGGMPATKFAAADPNAVLLPYLRHRRFGEAVEMLSNSRSSKLCTELLTALGFDWRKVFAGAWLDGRWMLEALCKDGSEEIAQMVLRWAELHWDETVSKREADKRQGVSRWIPGPQLPALDLLQLLAPTNTVTPATKQRIAAFLHAKVRLQDAGVWLRNPPPGTAQWLKPIARGGLHHERNDVRLMSEKVLHDAGEVDVKAELRPPARFRLFVNGELFLDRLGLSVEYGPGNYRAGLATRANPDRQGIITVDPDHFTPMALVRSAHFALNPLAPEEARIRAKIPLPPAFGQTTDIRVEFTKKNTRFVPDSVQIVAAIIALIAAIALPALLRACKRSRAARS